MQLIYIIMIVAGLILICWGFWATYNARRPWDMLGALSLPVALIITLMGVLLSAVPDFFKG